MTNPQGSSMQKAFDPKAVEAKWRAFWDERALFEAGEPGARPPFTMVIPPPNITGRLHVGHGLNNSLQDILARWKRMSGCDVLWVPGSDHASIATHVMIERELEKEGLTRQAIGREKFIERAWAWKSKFGGEIAEQLRRLGASCDWSRERFTMDPGLSRAVREVFVSLYEEGLIYRDRYMVNWCPRCATAVSDLEVVHKDTQGTLWTVAYPLEGGGRIRVATTRPETMLGDVAVAVHPDDDRHRPLIGRTARVPVLGRAIPVVADAFVDPAFGTGAVKVTPAHDPNDFLAGRRLKLEPIVVIDERGRMTTEAGPYAGLDRFECRSRLLARLKEEGLLEDEKPHQFSVGRCQRCDTIVEPIISTQWFVKIQPLAEPALAAVEQGRIVFVPDQWRKTYYEWMRNIRDWCISRQLWWGHRIPAWYCQACGQTIVSREDPTSCSQCGHGRLEQDPDILDTWFSSGLWAFSTLGWPETTEDLRRRYPTTVLVTGYDIIFFWVARMAMLGLKFMGEVPFHTVFFNGLVRDAHGEKISKMKGNVIDLFELMDTYGTDAVRFTYAALSSPGSDVSLAPGRLDGSRAFANKLWNASRFARTHLESGPIAPLPDKEALSVSDRWILSRSSRLAASVAEALTSFRFDEASSHLYQFAWHELCDWYLEIAKPALADPGSPRAGAARAVLAHVLDRLLRLLHPFMPFITEEIWQGLPRAAGAPLSIALAEYPRSEAEWKDDEAEGEMEAWIEIMRTQRNLAAADGPPASGTTYFVPRGHAVTSRFREPEWRKTIEFLTRSRFEEGPAPAGVPSRRGGTPGGEIAVALKAVDLDAERARLQREIERLLRDLTAAEAKLSNEAFVARAKPEAVDKVRSTHRDASERIARLKTTLQHLGS